MERLSLADSAFIGFESPQGPMHVASLLLFEAPAGGRSDFCRRLYERLRKHRSAAYPFNQQVVLHRTRLPTWETADDFDLDRHLFFHELPRPADRTALHQLVASLHEEMLSRDRPHWEYHLISGLKKNRFAVYIKVHHAYADGITLSSWVNSSFAKSSDERSATPLWAVAHGERKSRSSGEFHLIDAGRKMLDQQLLSARVIGGMARIGSQLLLEKINLTRNAISVPFSAPATILNGPLTADRQLATASVPMERVDRIRRAARVSLNQVAISCIDEGLHRYLEALGQPEEQPLVIAMPVSLRRGGRGQADRGNEVCMVLVELADETDDPYIRLRDVGNKLRYVRHQVDELPPQAMMGYSMLMGLVGLGLDASGIGRYVPPMSNLVVSNVPGPRETLYLDGARLLEHYPVSAIGAGHQLNITLYSYDRGLHFGLLGTQKLENLSRLGAYIHEAFESLERAVLDPLPGTRNTGLKEARMS